MERLQLDQVQLRDAVEDDLGVIVEIYNSSIPGRFSTADTEPVPVESRIHWFREHSPGFRPMWVAEYKGETCGWLSFQSFYGRPAYKATAEISIYVHPAYLGQGLGRFLLQHALEACPRIGVKTLLAFIFGHNQPSLNLFQSFEFEPWGNFPRIAELDGVERDLIIMGRRI